MAAFIDLISKVPVPVDFHFISFFLFTYILLLVVIVNLFSIFSTARAEQN